MAQRGEWNPVLAGLAEGPVEAGGVNLAAEGPGAYPGGHFLLLFTPESVRLCLRSKRTIPLTPGSFLLLRSRRGYRVEDGRVLTLRYPAAFFDGLLFSQLADCRILFDMLRLEDPEEEFLCFDYRTVDPVWSCALALCRELLTGDCFTPKLLHCGTTQLFTLLQRGFQGHLSVSRSTMLRDNPFGQLLKYMGDHYDTVTLADLARRFNYNPSYLSAYFRRVTGETFSQKLYHIRMGRPSGPWSTPTGRCRTSASPWASGRRAISSAGSRRSTAVPPPSTAAAWASPSRGRPNWRTKTAGHPDNSGCPVQAAEKVLGLFPQPSKMPVLLSRTAAQKSSLRSPQALRRKALRGIQSHSRRAAAPSSSPAAIHSSAFEQKFFNMLSGTSG